MGKLLIKLEYRKLKKHYVSSLNKGSTKKKVSITVICLQAESPEQSQGQPQAPSSDSESYSKLPKRDTEERALSQVSNTCSRQKVWWASSKEMESLSSRSHLSPQLNFTSTKYISKICSQARRGISWAMDQSFYVVALPVSRLHS